jgi:hypothetical protein
MKLTARSCCPVYAAALPPTSLPPPLPPIPPLPLTPPSPPALTALQLTAKLAK